MTQPSATDLIMGSGGKPPAKFDTIGTLVRGPIVATDIGQQRDFKTKEPLYWGHDRRPTTTPTDRPVLQAIITVQTDQHDPEILNDDGQRRIYVGGQSMREAVREAVIKAGAARIDFGGTLAVKYVSGSGNTGDPKQYTAEYAPPSIDVNLLTESDL